LSKSLGAKALHIQGQAGGGTVTVEQDESQRQALPDEQILALARLGEQAASHFGSPQDMEWAWANGQLYVVQSRPITSLYPLPANVAAEPIEVMLSFGVWQGMLDPYTPLGQDMLSYVVSGIALLFGEKIKPEEQHVLLRAGERLFVNLTGLLKTPRGRAVVEIFIAAMDPISSAILSKLSKELYFPAPEPASLRGRLRSVRAFLPVLYGILFNFVSPARGRARLERKIEEELRRAQSNFETAETLSDLVDAIAAVPMRLPGTLLSYLLPGVISGQIPMQVLVRLAEDVPGGSDLSLELTRGLPHNVTTEMDLALWQTAQSIRAEAGAAAYFNETEIPALISAYRSESLPPSIQTALASFMAKYGMRGIAEIDLGRLRWSDDPTHIFQVLKSYLQIDPENSPEAVFLGGAEKARLAQKQLIAAFQQTRGGRVKARVINMMILRLRELGGLRETPKFTVIRLFGHMRTALLNAGQKLVETGVLANARDIFFLHLPELKALAGDETRSWQKLIDERRAVYQRALQRKRIPRILLSDGTAFYDAPTSDRVEDENTLAGSPVSPGSVEGIVHVVLDPHGAQLVPGEILVCPATDPAWTPLFLTAGGLVMEIGGMMTHGSVVAREYGIPAVVGVRQATERLKTGQRVRVDGSSGKITILPG
jgi:pyruvate,water dikinase